LESVVKTVRYFFVAVQKKRTKNSNHTSKNKKKMATSSDPLQLSSTLSVTAVGGDTQIPANLLVNKNLIARHLFIPVGDALTFHQPADNGNGDSYHESSGVMQMKADDQSLKLGKLSDTALEIAATASMVDGTTASRVNITNAKVTAELEIGASDTGDSAAIRFKDKDVGNVSSFFEMKTQTNPLDTSRNQVVIRHSEAKNVRRLTSSDSEIIAQDPPQPDKSNLYPHTQQISNVSELRAGVHDDMLENEGLAPGSPWTDRFYIKLSSAQHAYIIEAGVPISAEDATISNQTTDAKYIDGSFYSGKLYKPWRQSSSPSTTWEDGDLYTFDSAAMMSISDDEVRLGVNLYVDGTLTITEGTAASFGDVANFSRKVTMEDELKVVGHTQITNGQLVVQGSHNGVGLQVQHNANFGSNLFVTNQLAANGDFRVGASNAEKFKVAASSGATNIESTLDVTGIMKVSSGFEVNPTTGFLNVGPAGDHKFKVAMSDGSTTIKGQLDVSNAGEFDSTLGADGDFRVGIAGSEKFSVAAVSGATNIQGDFQLGATGSEKFKVAASTGNTEILGNLEFKSGAGIETFKVMAESGNTSIKGSLDVTEGDTTVQKAIVKDSLEVVSSGDNLRVVYQDEQIVPGGQAIPAGMALMLKSSSISLTPEQVSYLEGLTGDDRQFGRIYSDGNGLLKVIQYA
jgi:hypothetical protein